MNLTKGHFFDLDKFNERFKNWGNSWAKVYIKRKEYTNRAGNPSTIYTIYFKYVSKDKIIDKMEIGDSFTVKTEKKRNNVMVAWNSYAIRNQDGKNKKFTSKKIGDHEYRIWRIK